MAPQGVAYGIYGQVIKGPAQFRAFHAAFRSVFSGIRIEVLEEIGCGQYVAIRCRAKLRHIASGKRLTLPGMAFIEIRSGKIVKARNHWDFLTLLEAMELLPESSFELAISGQLAAHPQTVGMQQRSKKPSTKSSTKPNKRPKRAVTT